MSICISNVGSSSNSNSSSETTYGTIIGNGKIVKVSGKATTSYRGDWDWKGDGGPKISEYDNLFKQAGKLLDIDWKLIAAQVWKESNFLKDTISSAKAGGLYQFMEQWWGGYAPSGREGLKWRFDPEVSTNAYVKLMTELLNRYKSVADRNQQILFALQGYHDGAYGGLGGTTWVNRTKGSNTKESNEYVPLIMDKYKSYGGDVQN